MDSGKAFSNVFVGLDSNAVGKPKILARRDFSAYVGKTVKVRSSRCRPP